jgi:hypothetical protein
MYAAKAVVAVVGSAITAALGLIPPEETLWIVLTIASAALTTLAVYITPNTTSTA